MKETKITIQIDNDNDMRFAYLLQDILSERGYKCTGSGFGFGKRDLWYEIGEIPENADFIPKPIEVNLPDLSSVNNSGPRCDNPGPIKSE